MRIASINFGVTPEENCHRKDPLGRVLFLVISELKLLNKARKLLEPASRILDEHILFFRCNYLFGRMR